jgi:hypothetical protein
MNIYSQVIGQIIRYALTALAVYLGLVGVTENQQHELVETIVNWSVPIVLALAVQVWSYYRKKYASYLVETALLSPEGTPIERIALEAKSAVKEDSTALAKIVLPSLLIWCLVLTTTACPSRASLDKAARASSDLATYANAGVNVTRELFAANLLTLEQKDRIADGFIALARAGQAFDTLVANARVQYGDNAPKDAVAAIFATFDKTVVNQLVSVLNALKLTQVSARFAAVIETLKTAVLLIANAFRHRQLVAARLEAA